MRTTLRPAVRSMLIFSAELVFGPACCVLLASSSTVHPRDSAASDIPMVQMILVRRKALGGLYSVLRLDSHSTRVLPNSWCVIESAILIAVDVYVVLSTLLCFSSFGELNRQLVVGRCYCLLGSYQYERSRSWWVVRKSNRALRQGCTLVKGPRFVFGCWCGEIVQLCCTFFCELPPP